MKPNPSKIATIITALLISLTSYIALLHAADVYLKEAPIVIIDDKSAFFGAYKIYVFNHTPYAFKLDFEDNNKKPHSLTIQPHSNDTLTNNTKLAFQGSEFYFEILKQKLNKETDLKKRDKEPLTWTYGKYEKEFWFDPLTKDGDEYIVIQLAFEFESENEIRITINQEGEQE